MSPTEDAAPSDGPPPEAMAADEAAEEIGRLRRRLAALEAAHPDAARRAVDEGRLHELFQEAPALIALMRGPAHTFVFVNPAHEAIFGDRARPGRPLREALPTSDAAVLPDAVDAVYRTGEPWHARALPLRRTGGDGVASDPAYFDLTVRPWRGADGAVDGVAWFGFDVTDLVHARAKLEAALQVSRTGTYDLHAATRRVEGDDELRSLFELPDDADDDVEAFLVRIHPADRARVEQTIRSRLAGIEDVDLEYRIVRRDGSVRWMWDKARVQRDGEGAVVRMIGACTDITPRKQTEEALRRSEERFRLLIEAATSIVWTTGPAGQAHRMPAWASFTGQTHDEYADEGWLAAVHPEDRARTIAAWREAVARVAPYEVRHRVRRHDGVYRHMLARAIPLVEDGEVREWVGTHTDITDVVRAEAELRHVNETLEERVAERTQALSEANERLRRTQADLSLAYRRLSGVLDSTEDYISVVDRDMRLTAFNAAYADEVESSFGLRPTLGMGPNDVLPLLDPAFHPFVERSRAQWARVFAGEAFTVEVSVPFPDGRTRHFETRYSPIRDDDGAVIGGVSLGRDITERYEAQEAVRRNEQHFREALSGSSVVLARIDRERRYQWIHNPTIDADGMIGRRDDELFPADEVAPLVALKEHVMATGVSARRELTFRIGGAPRVYDISATPLKDAAGRIVGLTTATLDVTEYRQAQEALRRSEALYRTVVRSMTEGMLLYDADGVITASNPAAERILRRASDAILGRTRISGDHEAVREDGTPYPEDELPIIRALQTGQAALARTIGVRTPDRALRWLSVNAQPLVRDEDIEGVVVTFRDITAAKGAEERLARTNRELEQRNRELQDFAYVASHDLQEPLRKIRAFADLLETDRSEEIGEDGRHYLDRIQHAAARMSQLITDLLAFSRVQTRGETFTQVDLGEVLGEVLTDLEVAVDQSGGTVDAGPLPTIEADPLQMRQLLQNLVGNALKFRRPEAPPEIRVRAAVEPGAGGRRAMCVLEVEDNGIGFEAKYVDRIFAPFQRLHGRSAYEGTGMGLAICRRIVERHGGDITAVPNADAGVTFVVHLPVRQG